MRYKFPVSPPCCCHDNRTINTSRRQGRNREEPSEGSILVDRLLSRGLSKEKARVDTSGKRKSLLPQSCNTCMDRPRISVLNLEIGTLQNGRPTPAGMEVIVNRVKLGHPLYFFTSDT